MSAEALEILSAYSFPGNVRELKNEIQRAFIMANDIVEFADLSAEATTSSMVAPVSGCWLFQTIMRAPPSVAIISVSTPSSGLR